MCRTKTHISINKCGLLLTSSSDLNSSNHLSLDAADEEGPGEAEAGYKNLGSSVALSGGVAAGQSVAFQLPLYGAALLNHQRAAVPDDTGG